MISNAVCLSVRLSVCLPLCPSSRSSPSFPLNAKEMSFAKLGKQRVGVGKKLSKFATWSPKEEGRKEGGREGHYTATIHPTHRKGGKEGDSIQHETDVVLPTLRRGEVTTLGADGRGLSASSIPVHTPAEETSGSQTRRRSTLSQ